MLNNIEILNRFLKSKDLYRIVLGDDLYDDYFLNPKALQAYRVLESVGMVNLQKVKGWMLANKKNIELYPSKALAGSYSESYTGEGKSESGVKYLGGS